MKYLPVFCLLFGVAAAIPPLETFEEGACLDLPELNLDVDRELLNTFKYVPAGSKYAIYLLASTFPVYENMTEDEFKNSACLYQETSTDPTVPSTVWMFGKPISLAKVDLDKDGISGEIEGPAGRGETTQSIGFTDNKTFVLFVTCWKKHNQRTWSIITKDPTISPATKRDIEARALSFGFKMENFVFLNYDNCPKFPSSKSSKPKKQG